MKIYHNAIPILLLISLICASACGGSRSAGRQLDAAERLIPGNPDSAVSILARMDTTRMSEKQLDRRILLYAYAHAIHALPLPLDTADVLWGDSVFRGTYSPEEVKWLITRSVDARLKGDAVARIESLKEGEFLALQLERKFDLALIYQYLANVYEKGFNGTVSKYYADKSVSILNDLDFPKQLRESKMAVVGALAAKQDYTAMRDSLLAMRAEVMANAAEPYRAFFLDQLARSYLATGEPSRAIAIWSGLYDEFDASANTLAHWALAYMKTGRTDSARLLVDKALTLPLSNEEEYMCRNIQYQILARKGERSQLARIDSLRMLAADNTFGERKLEESSLAVNLKYDSAAKAAWHDASVARTRTVIAIIVAMFFALAASAVWLYLRKRNQVLRLEHENDVLRIRTLQDNLFEADSRNKDASARISELFSTRFRLIDSLATSYFECKETGQEQKRIYSEVKESIRNFSSDAATKELEQVVDGYNYDLMARFRKDFPALSKAQYRLATYIFCGFSLPSVSIFTGSDLRNIYVYKSRLKGMISRSDSPHKDEYLEFFS